MKVLYFEYGQEEMEYLKSKDKHLAEVIDRIGKIERTVNPDLFSALINAIVGQQISTKAQQTVWKRMHNLLGEITPISILNRSKEDLQGIGLSFRKVDYIRNIAQKVADKELDLEALHGMNDEDLCAELSNLKGIGKWTAEMIMLFSMQRKNILSDGDLAILRGMRMLYHHRKITNEKFQKYWRRYSPYASIASLYLWAIAGGALPEMKDYAPKNKKK